ncbi:hypothetical protein [Curvibacter gracilis]|uniref:hypothetical protein n=1 Tax=Curvibacter gracilis TaxID=230310 RepID=UPI000488197E|nr:hypothetical protein [Curvibacter gracilis]
MTAETTPSLPLSGLEDVYDALASAIDQAGPEKSELFLVKLALLNAQRLGSADLVREHIEVALKDL